MGYANFRVLTKSTKEQRQGDEILNYSSKYVFGKGRGTETFTFGKCSPVKECLLAQIVGVVTCELDLIILWVNSVPSLHMHARQRVFSRERERKKRKKEKKHPDLVYLD